MKLSPLTGSVTSATGSVDSAFFVFSFLPSLSFCGSVKGFMTVTGSVGSVTFMGGGTNILLSLPSLFYRRVFLNFERTSEQDESFRTVKGIAEKRRIEQSPNKPNGANTNRTQKTALQKALQTLFACSADSQLQREISCSIP